MKYNFLNIFLEQDDLLNQAESKINPFLLENNSGQLQKFYNFYKSDVNLLYLNGFLGTGKAEIVNYSTLFLSKETIVLKYNCFNSTILDDILLAFFSEFKNLSAQNIISAPQIKTENFTQKINSYFAQIEKPFVIILDSFEAILSENRQEILDFIFHLNSIPKTKVILIGRTFENKYFERVPLERITTFALDKQVFEKYLKAEKIKSTSLIIEEFYKHTRGYYFFTAFSIKLMKKDDLTLVEFLTKLKESYLPLYDFLVKQSLNLVPSSEKHLFWFLSTIRHPVSLDLLKKLDLYNEEKFTLLTDSLILIQDNSQIYVQDYIKRELDDSIAPNIAHRIHHYIIDLYQTQLPLKPLKRDILISRQTMRKEIEYHELFLPKKYQRAENSPMDINYMSYATTTDLEKIEKTRIKGEEKAEPKKPKYQVNIPDKKNININLENLPYQSNMAKLTPTSYPITPDKNIENESGKIQNEYETISLKEILKLINEAGQQYQYTQIIDLAQRALELKGDKDYKTYLPLIHTKLAQAYQETAKYENSLQHYFVAQELYIKAQKPIKADYVKLNISKIFYETYKIENAKELLLEIISKNKNPSVLKIKAYLRLANLEENLSNIDSAFDYYKAAVETTDEAVDAKTLSELYFKYALALDDKNDTKNAIEFYNKCIKTSDNQKTNKYLSPAYSNIATLYLEKNDTQNAIDTYKKAYEIDKQNNNIEGMYYSSTKLASILQKNQPEDALTYMKIALDCAKQTKDVFYIVSAALAIGDFHYDRKQSEIALKHYIYALDFAQNKLSADNLNKINVRINDIKFKIGVENFDKLVEIIREQKEE